MQHLKRGYEMHKVVIGVQPRWISSSSPSRAPGPVHTKIIAYIVFGLWFQRSTYVWKANEITFTMNMVSRQNSFQADGNSRNKKGSRICPGVASSSLDCWTSIMSKSNRDSFRGPRSPLEPIYSIAVVNLGLDFTYIISAIVVSPLVQFVEPQLRVLH